LPLFGRRHTFPIPAILPATCDKCGARLRWVAVTEFDPVIGLEKVDHYRADCACGEVHYRDGRGQVVEPAVENLAPDRSEFANSPQGPQPYSGYMEFVKQERAKAEALKVAQAKKVADAAAAAAGGAPTSPAERPSAAELTAAPPAPAAALSEPGAAGEEEAPPAAAEESVPQS
jgi:hypothetical protein